MAAPKLKEIRLPAGDVIGINVGWFRDGAQIKIDPRTLIAEGYDGARIIGAGIDRTVLRADLYDGVSFNMGRGPWIVQLEAMTIVPGFSMGIQAGEQNLQHELVPKFQLRLVEIKGTVGPPMPGFQRTKWWCFTYQCDVFIRDVTVDGAMLAEHDFYFHNWAGLGLDCERLNCLSSGAQNVKVRCPANETAYAGAKCKVRIRHSSFARAGQPWSDRGNGLIVGEGTASIWEIEDCVFRASRPNDPEAHAIMLSSEPGSYGWDTGGIGTGFGNGPITIRRIAAHGWRPDDSGLRELIRIGPNGTTQKTTPNFLLEDSGVYGRNTWAQLGGIPKGKGVIRGCNTPEIKARCDLIGGIDTTSEAVWPGPQRLVPLSEGVVV